MTTFNVNVIFLHFNNCKKTRKSYVINEDYYFIDNSSCKRSLKPPRISCPIRRSKASIGSRTRFARLLNSLLRFYLNNMHTTKTSKDFSKINKCITFSKKPCTNWSSVLDYSILAIELTRYKLFSVNGVFCSATLSSVALSLTATWTGLRRPARIRSSTSRVWVAENSPVRLCFGK